MDQRIFFGCLQMRRNQLVALKKTPFIFVFFIFEVTIDLSSHCENYWESNEIRWCDMMRQIIYCHRVCDKHLAAKSSFVTRPPVNGLCPSSHYPNYQSDQVKISFSFNQTRAASMTMSKPRDRPSSPQIARSQIWNWFEFWQGLAGIPVPGHSHELKASDFRSRTLGMFFFSFLFPPRP